jgi:hypothetical protein
MRYATMLLVLFLTGCASVQEQLALSLGSLMPGMGVDRPYAEAICGDYATYEGLLEPAKIERRESTGGLRPQPGMSACEVIARIGKPHEVTTVQVTGHTAYHWTYWETPAGTRTRRARLVVLEPQDATLVVSSVVW